jgi:adenosine deaminase
MRTSLLLSIDRRHSLTVAQSIVSLASTLRFSGVVGIDLCGDPSFPNSISHFTPAFHAARAQGLKCTLHFAEAPQSSSPEELSTLLSFAPERLGHVIHVPEDVRREIEGRGLGLELCLSCNVHAGMVEGGFAGHHFGWWWGRGCPIALSVGFAPLLYIYAFSFLFVCFLF